MNDKVVQRLEEAGYFGDRVAGLKQRFKNAANATGHALGSSHAGGRFEVGVVVRQLMQLWGRYKGINDIQEGSTPDVVAFLKSLGFAMEDKEIAKIYAGAYAEKSPEEQAAADISPKTDARSPQMRKQISMLGMALVKQLSVAAGDDRTKIDTAFKRLIAKPDFTNGSKLFNALQKIDIDDRVVLFKMSYEAFLKRAKEPHEWGVLFAKYYQGINFADQIWSDKVLNAKLWPVAARLIIQSGAGDRVMSNDDERDDDQRFEKRKAGPKDEEADDEGSKRKKTSREKSPSVNSQLVEFDRQTMNLRLQRVLPRGMSETLADLEGDENINSFDDMEHAIAAKFGNNPAHLTAALAAFITTIKSGL